MMKKGFTLVEMLIVVVVLVTLMAIAFRLSSVGENQSARAKTIMRLQRVENCLSGYMAAFGTYPPVRLHASRNIYTTVDEATYVQKPEDRATINDAIWGWKNIGDVDEMHAWLQVKAACEAQPVACEYPYTTKLNEGLSVSADRFKERIRKGTISFGKNDARKNLLASGFSALSVGGLEDTDDWRESQVYRFGLLSFLLPRYLLMMDCDSATGTQLFSIKQWTGGNVLPASNPLTGAPFSGWDEIRGFVENGVGTKNYAAVANLASQAACARWMSNLEGICACDYSMTFFGFDVRDSVNDDISMLNGNDVNARVYRPADGGQTYALDGITVRDGWGTDLFYYSPPPYQSYVLWSAGPNERTFPPWVDRKRLGQEANKCVGLWIEDDIVHLSN